MVSGREEVKDPSHTSLAAILSCKDHYIYIYIYEFIKEKADDRMRKSTVTEVNTKQWKIRTKQESLVRLNKPLITSS